MTEYVDLFALSNLQFKIMEFVDDWIKANNKPVAREEIFDEMLKNGQKAGTIKRDILELVKKGYLRKAIMPPGVPLNKTFYVQLRRV